MYTQEDDRVFPKSDSSQTIIDCFMQELSKLKITVKMGVAVTELNPINNSIELVFRSKEKLTETFNKVIVATGGSPRREGLEWLEDLGHKIENPVPSLFTFNMPEETIKSLMGVVAKDVSVSIQGTKLKSSGPLLITHWGMSGPAILKLSAFGARVLHDMDYKFKIQVSWANESNHEKVLIDLKGIVEENPKKRVANVKPYSLPERLWLFLLEKRGIPQDKIWSELGSKYLNKLVDMLCLDVYEVKGKTTFKEEFVTCGGVSLDSVNLMTMQSIVCPNLYFAGEVLDIDAITGGYNFQAAWTTGFIAGKLMD